MDDSRRHTKEKGRKKVRNKKKNPPTVFASKRFIAVAEKKGPKGL